MKNFFLKTIVDGKSWIAALVLLSATNSQAQTPEFQWAKRAGGVDAETSYAVATDTSGNVYVTGTYQSSISFGTTTLSASGSSDIFLVKYDASGNVLWAKGFGGTGFDQARALNVAPDGSVYISGSFTSSTIDFDPTSSAGGLTNGGDHDVFFVKYTSSGSFVFANKFTGLAQEAGYDIAFDDSSNVYIAGQFQSTIDVDFSSNTYSLTSAGSHDVFLAKYTPTGSIVWARQAGGISDDQAFSVAVKDNFVYVAGFITGSANFSTHNVVSNGATDAFLAKYSTQGALVWAAPIGGAGSDQAFGIAVNAAGNIFVGGFLTGSANFSSSTSLTSNGGQDVFFACYNSAGNLSWAKNIGSSNDDELRNLAIDEHSNIYLTGQYSGTTDFDPSSNTVSITNNSWASDIYAAKYDSAGNFKWVLGLPGGGSDVSQAICLDKSENVFIAGAFESDVDFDLSTNTTQLSSAGSTDLFIAKYSQPADTTAASVAIVASSSVEMVSNVFPNPTQNAVNIMLNDVYNDLNVIVFDNLGRILSQQQVASADRLGVDLSDFANGLYYVQVISGTQRNIVRVQVSK